MLTFTGVPAQSDLQPPKADSVPNPRRPSNPFSLTKEQDWISSAKLHSTTGSLRHAAKSATAQVEQSSNSFLPPARRSRDRSRQRDSSQNSDGHVAGSLPSEKSERKLSGPPIPKKPAVLSTQSHSTSSKAEPKPKLDLPAPSPTSSARHPGVEERIRQLRLSSDINTDSLPGQVISRNMDTHNMDTHNMDAKPAPLLPPRRTDTAGMTNIITTSSSSRDSGGSSSSSSHLAPTPTPTETILDSTSDTEDMRRSLRSWRPLDPQ